MKLKEMTSSLDQNTLDMVDDFLNEGSTRSLLLLASLALRLGFVVHISACGWVFVARQSQLRGENSWLTNDFNGYEAVDTEGPHADSIYIASFYYVLTTMTSVGYGDILPLNDDERVYAIILEFLGGFIFAMIIANITSVISSADMNTRKTEEQLDAVSSFVANRQFPTALGRRIRRHFRQFYSHKSAIDERKIFSEMSATLRRDVSVYLVSVRMSDVKLFQTLNPKIWPKLFPILNPTNFELGEMVCLQDDECSEMFIVLEGSLQGWTVLDTAAQEASKGVSPTRTVDPTARFAEAGNKSGTVSAAAAATAGSALTNDKSSFSKGDLGKGLNRVAHVGRASELPADAIDNEYLKQRHIGAGESLNVLCVLKVWNRSVETVVAETPVEAYSVSADDFHGLFNHDNELDRSTFEEMRHQELKSYRMDVTKPAPTHYGVPLYMAFSCVTVTVVAARGIAPGDWGNTSDPYATIELVRSSSDFSLSLSLLLSLLLSLSLSLV